MLEITAHIIQPTDWIQVIIAVTSIVISVAAVFISFITYTSQRKHNQNSVRPILNIVFGDYEDNIYVKIVNNGVGPATIKDLKFSVGNNTTKSLVELIPGEAIVTDEHRGKIVDLHTFNDFVEDVTGRTLPPNGTIMFLQLQSSDKAQILALRNFLGKVEMSIDYTDIYSKKTWVVDRSLSFFQRTISPNIKIVY